MERPHMWWSERALAVLGTILTFEGLETGYNALRGYNPSTILTDFIDNPFVLAGIGVTLGGLCLLASIPYRGRNANKL